MAEPLTKDKLFCAGCNCKEDNHPNVGHHYVGLTSIEDLKSALEEFEKECDETAKESHKMKNVFKDLSDLEITGYKIGLFAAIRIMKKAFPAIYESEVER